MTLRLGKLYSSIKEKCDDKIELTAGDGGLDKAVLWMYMVESIEVSHLLEGGEIAFITGIALTDDNDLFDLVEDIYNHGASGIVITTGTYINEIPQNIIDFCNEKSMPLFRMTQQLQIPYVMKLFAEEITLSDKRSMELILAVKNAIYFSDNYDLYVPTFEMYGYHVNHSYCAAVCECTNKNGTESADDILECVKEFAENALTSLVQNAVVFRLESQIVMLFVNMEEKEIADTVNSVVQSLPADLEEKINIYIGIGRNTQSMHCIDKTFNVASKTAKLQKKRMVSGKAILYRNLGISRLFLTMENVEIMREFYGEVLKPLVDYDKKNHTDFVGFLKVYFTYGGHVRETAQGMYLHRNSINYKMRKIEEILGCDLSNINDKAQILIALNLMELL